MTPPLSFAGVHARNTAPREPVGLWDVPQPVPSTEGVHDRGGGASTVQVVAPMGIRKTLSIRPVRRNRPIVEHRVTTVQPRELPDGTACSDSSRSLPYPLIVKAKTFREPSDTYSRPSEPNVKYAGLPRA